MTQLARREDEAGALVRLGFDELHGATRSIGTMERDLAARAFRYVPAGKPIRFVHDTAANGVVGALGGVAAALGRSAETLVGGRPRPQRPLSATVPGGMGLAALNGLIGDRLEREGSPLQEPISVRVGGFPVPPERDEVAHAFPQASPRLVVFVHGLMGEEHGWRLGVRQGRLDYGTRLSQELGFTPVYVRYNSGRHISENGRSLADLLESVVAAWPVEVEQIAESHCAFRAALSFPDVVRAGLRVAHLGRSSVRYEIGLFRAEDDAPATEGWFVHVFGDRGVRRPRGIPEGLRAALERLEVS